MSVFAKRLFKPSIQTYIHGLGESLNYPNSDFGITC